MQILSMNSISYKYDYVFELLEDILTHDASSRTDLIVCSTKNDFLEQLIPTLNARNDEESRPTTPQPGEEDGQPETPIPPRPGHDLLLPTLHLLKTSQSVNLIFCPTIPTLRGYLSGYNPASGPASSNSQPPSPGADQVVILNLLGLHHGSPEFNLQGLSQTFATAAAAAHRTSRRLKLVECRNVNDSSSPIRGSGLWQVEVPLLSGSIKIGEGGMSWGRRTVSVIEVASRWFKVQNWDKIGKRASSRDRPASAEKDVPI